MDPELDSAVGFLSYSHVDDEADEGRIRRLAKKIQSEYRVLTGQQLEIFVDRSDLRWGQKWKERIDGALQSTTFFIPVLSPSFFASNECRREFFEFFNTTRALGVPRYLLAIRYAPVDDLVAASSDQAKAIAAETQYKNWEELRLVDESSAEHRQAINDLAQELRQLMREVQAQPAGDAAGPGKAVVARETVQSDQSASSSTSDGGDDDDPYGDAPSALELAADLPARAAAWNESLTGIKEASSRFNVILTNGSEDLAAVDKAGKPLAAKILVLRRIADELDAPTKDIEEAGEHYMKALLNLDPSFRAVAELGHAQTTATDKDRDALSTAQSSVRTMIEAGTQATASIRRAIQGGRDLARLSRDLRPALKRYETGSQNILDGQLIMEEWGKLLDAVSWPEESSKLSQTAAS